MELLRLGEELEVMVLSVGLPVNCRLYWYSPATHQHTIEGGASIYTLQWLYKHQFLPPHNHKVPILRVSFTEHWRKTTV